MKQINYTIEDISEDSSCLVCEQKHCDWTPYIRPKDKEVGTLCPICYTHFIDIDNSRAEFEGY